MPKYTPLTKADLKERIKEIEARIKQMDRREKTLEDFKRWMASRKLAVPDVAWMLKQMKPKRAATAAKSKLPLKAANDKDFIAIGGQKVPRKGDPNFRRAIREARMDHKWTPGDVGKKIGVSSASIENWEQGRVVPKEDGRLKVLKALGLPMTLGAKPPVAPNGRAAAE